VDQVEGFFAWCYVWLEFASLLHLLAFFAYLLLEFNFDLILPLLAALENRRC
jgi:hypothetical protein